MSGEWDLLLRLGLALALSSAIGVEREMRQKSAGMRTYTLVGVGAALFVLVSIYGFSDTLQRDTTVLDPSRVAAQIVSGIGFIGGGLIFVRRDAVRGLTTAAGVWLTAAVGMAAGAGLAILATAGTVAYLVVAYAYPELTQRLPSSRRRPVGLDVTYVDGRGILRTVLASCTEMGFAVADLRTQPVEGDARAVAVQLELRGAGQVADLAAQLDAVDGVLAVRARSRGRRRDAGLGRRCVTCAAP
jgi:putative Mg2+ transporter-C (MgtC) family protein